jgi:hypothetical protein
MIEQQKEKHNWEFIFLGANIDAVEVANSFGIARNRAQNFHNDSKGIALNYTVVSEAISFFREAHEDVGLDDDWSEKVEADFVKRKR